MSMRCRCAPARLFLVRPPPKVAAAREVYAEAAQDSGAGTGLFGRPALERLIAHPKLLPIYEEFAGDDQLHLVSAGLLHDQPKAEGAPLQPGQNALLQILCGSRPLIV